MKNRNRATGCTLQVKGWLKLLKEQAKRSPLFCKLNARKFHNVKDFIKWENFLLSLATFHILASVKDFDERDYVIKNLSFVVEEIYQKYATTFPVYWLDKELGQAFLQTKLPPVLQLKRSHYVGAIFLPDGLLESPEGEKVHWLLFAHRLKEEEIKLHVSYKEIWVTDYPESVLQVCLIGDNHHSAYFSSSSLDRTHPDGKPYSNPELFSNEKVKNEAAEKDFLRQAQSIALQCLFWLQFREPQEVVTSAVVPSGVGFGKSPKLLEAIHALNPRWIGKNYAIKKQRDQNSSSASSCDRASPVTHWRTGHWRNQKVGTGRTEARMLWIEPILINPD